jgi:fructose-bisphosphate aldolase class I
MAPIRKPRLAALSLGLFATFWVSKVVTFVGPNPATQFVRAGVRSISLRSYGGYESRFPDPAKKFEEELQATAKAIAAPGKGILASDESNPTCGKRFDSIGVENTEENRRKYRELLFTAPGLNEHISGAILYEETLYQSTKDGKKFVDLLKEQGIVPGIKVDAGLRCIPGTDGEQYCTGLDNLPERCREYYKAGARFAKWRAVLSVSKDGKPSDVAIEHAASGLAAYASIAQSEGLAPFVEPEILMDGDHDIVLSQRVHEDVWAEVYRQLELHGVMLEGTLLKPSMITPGVQGPKATPQEIAEATIEGLRRRVPSAVPGIMFLSGGQSEEEATLQLNRMNQVDGRPWSVSFSYGRALQASVLKVWDGKDENIGGAQKMLLAIAKANGEANLGKYDDKKDHPSSTGSLFVENYAY